jgi:hypothetical protein
MSGGRKAAQEEQIREIVRDLEAIKFRLIGVAATLPPSPAENDRLKDVGSEETDPVSAFHAVIQCVLNDSLQPAIEDLRDMAGLAAEPPPPGDESPGGGL